MACNCNTTQKICGCQQPTCTPIECGCPVYLTSDCINNVKAVFECSEIESGLSLTETLEQLDAFICTKFNSITNYFTLINVGGEVEVYKGVNGIGQKTFRTLVSTSPILDITQNTDTVSFDIVEQELINVIEENQTDYNAESLGDGVDVYKEEVANTFRFKSVKSSDNSVTITDEGDYINFTANITADTVITEGDNVTITGTGTTLDPYVINAATVSMQNGTTTTVSGDGVVTPFSVEVENLQKTISSFPYTLSNTDDKYTIFVNNGASDVVINVPDGLVNNFSVVFIQEGTGQVTVQQSGSATLLYPSTSLQNIIKGQYYWCMVEKKLNTNNYYLLGSLKTV